MEQVAEIRLERGGAPQRARATKPRVVDVRSASGAITVVRAWRGVLSRSLLDDNRLVRNELGSPGCPLVIPLMDKHDAGRRSHYQTIHLNIPDAPADDEIVVALGASVGGHPHHRIGNRYEDLKDMGHDVDNPAGI